MKRLLCIGIACAIGLAFCGCAKKAPAAVSSIEGTWEGALQVPGGALRLVVRFARKPGGAISGSMDSPNQGAAEIPIEKAEVKGSAVHFSVATVNGSYDGKLSPGETEMTGNWSQSGMSFPLSLKKSSKATAAVVTAPKPNRPQEPKKPYPYDEQEVSYENVAAKVKLAGTLTLPRGGGPFPAVVLITGSGAQNRDEALLGHRPFLVLADYLTRRGIAVLRVDDRGVGGSTGDLAQSTSADFAGDVLTGVGYLKGRKEINPKQIGLIGHSEGGMIAPMAAARSGDVAFIVLMAGTGVPLEQILYAQAALISRDGGASPEAIALNLRVQKRMFAVAKSVKDDALAAEKIREILDEESRNLPPSQRAALRSQSEINAMQITTPWFRFALTFDPRTALVKVKCPVLAINGDRDHQVPPQQNLPEIEKALRKGGNTHVTVKVLPGLNHLFQTCKTGAVTEYSQIEETIAPVALKTMGDWIVAQTGAKGR